MDMKRGGQPQRAKGHQHVQRSVAQAPGLDYEDRKFAQALRSGRRSEQAAHGDSVDPPRPRS